MLRAALWAVTRDFLKATRWAARTGTRVRLPADLRRRAVVFSLDNPIGGLWTGFIGWILVQASQAAYRQSRAESRSRRRAGARRSCRCRPTWIPGDITLRKAANDYFLALDTRCLPVQDDHGRLEGLVCVSDLQRTDRAPGASTRCRT